MKLLSIDAGSEQSAHVEYNTTTGLPEEFGIIENESVLMVIAKSDCDIMVIEDIESFGMAVGKSVFDTCKWIGQFTLQWKRSRYQVCSGWNRSMKPYYYLKRSEVKMSLCNTMRAKDTNVRQAIMDLYGTSKSEVIGTKNQKGPLYGIKSHLWSALAVAIVGNEKFLK